MLKYYLAISVVLFTALYAGSSVVPNDETYYKYDRDNVQIIFTKKNLPFAQQADAKESEIHKDYEYFYNWKLDEKLYVGLISDCNQIANGFSTQWPNNRQINYIGGTKLVDYFSSTSWLDTLLYHETAHNYQFNLKSNHFSQILHSIFGNGSFFIPYFTIPNIMENAFMYEGNAVLNESWHGNGGRLYNGRFKAETLLQAKEGHIVAAEVYNSKLAFPYGDIVYIQGAFYNLYMAQHYGLRAINSYFSYHSDDVLWPLMTNDSMQSATGKTFEQSLNAFAKTYALEAQNLVMALGKKVTSSQFYYELNSDAKNIYFLTNKSGVNEPELVVVDKKSGSIRTKDGSWLGGKVVKENETYYTQASNYTSPFKIQQGLFDSEAFIKEDTASKMIQGYLSDGRAVYFDVSSSFSEPMLYVDGIFYAQVNSSVIIDKKDNLYYFVQDAKKRTLYRNKTPLFSYQGFYGIVSDVDIDGNIYFVANSKYGSTLYKYTQEGVLRVSEADNIVDARLVDNKHLLIAAVGTKEYYYVIASLKSIEQQPYETKLFFETQDYYGNKKEYKSHLKMSKAKEYNSLLDMHYSGTDTSFAIGDNGLVGYLNMNFGDPLTQNATSLFISRDDSNVTIAGASYSNSLYLLEYSLYAYGVADKDKRANTRDSGVMAQMQLPLYKTGYYDGYMSLTYFQDYDTLAREPLSLYVALSRVKTFGVSMYPNSLNDIKLYAVEDRGDKIYGGSYQFTEDMPYESYVGLAYKYSQTDSNTWVDKRGVKITNATYQNDLDISAIDFPSLDATAYVKEASYAEASLTKVMNFSSYFFTFPVSLRREALYTKYRYYNIEDYNQKRYYVNEATLGVTLSSVLLNSFVVPFSFEYIYNDADFIKSNETLRFVMGVTF
ncbi:hypothetical protein [Sulfurimonas sp.]